MKTALMMVLIAGFLPLVCAGIAKARARDYDNHAPRHWESKLTGYRARANAAQANSFEAFPFFAAAVLAALQAGVDGTRVDAWATAFVLARVAYIYCYVRDLATLRSSFWALGLVCTVGLFVLAISA